MIVLNRYTHPEREARRWRLGRQLEGTLRGVLLKREGCDYVFGLSYSPYDVIKPDGMHVYMEV